MIISIIIFLIIFSVVVISHEFGHYAIARRNGIRVNEFDIGMGPMLAHKKMGETDFCIRLLPVGGACIFDGLSGLEEEETILDEHSFPNAGVYARIATVLGGPAANFILGFVLSLIVVAFSGTDLPVVQGIMEDSAAMEAGIQEGDVIKKINGENIHIYREVSIISMMNYGEPMKITYERDGALTTVDLVPKYSEEAGRYYIGLLGSGEYHTCSAPEVFKYAWYETFYWLKSTVKSLGSMVSGHFDKDDVSGSVGIVKAVDDTYEAVNPYGLSAVILSFMSFATLLTVNLGVINLLPIPALDGGRLLFLLIEAVRGKKVPAEKEGYITAAGIIFLLVVMVLVLFNDISRFFR